MKKRSANYWYPVKVWLSTIILGPVFAYVLSLFLDKKSHFFTIEYRLMPAMIFFGIMFSIPALFVYFLFFVFLADKKINPVVVINVKYIRMVKLFNYRIFHPMTPKHLNILLADDDFDDCLFFKSIVDEFPLSTLLTDVHDGEQLMELLTNDTKVLPHILFLDLNMPRKNGFECLAEIKLNDKLKALPVIMYSTSFEQNVMDRLYQNGAQHFIRKPSNFLQFKRVIHYALTLIMLGTSLQRTKNNFILTGEKDLIHPETF